MLSAPTRFTPTPVFNSNSFGTQQPTGAPASWPYALHNEPIADALFSLTGTPDSAIGLDLDSRGTLWRAGLNGKEPIGAVNALGQYWFKNGQQGDFFETRNPSKEGLLEITLDNAQHPFIQTLRTREQQRAQAGSEIPLLRSKFNALGLNGQGIKIGAMDPYEPVEIEDIALKTANGEPGQAWSISDHSNAVSELVTDPIRGLAPGAKVIDAGFVPIQDDSMNDADDISVVQSNMTKSAAHLFDETSQKLTQLQSQRASGLRIFSITAGGSLLTMLEFLREDLNKQNANGEWRYPRTRQQIMGPAVAQGPEAQDQALLNFLGQILRNSTVQQAQQRYIEATRQASLNGQIIVAAAGNEHGQIARNIIAPPSAEFDELAKSPYVISVAAADTHQTPSNLSDDSIAPFSSWGDGRMYAPTIAAPGQGIYLSKKFETLGSNQVESGTSYAVPFICSTIALMLQANPFLTFPQVKTILQQSAVPLPGYPLAAQGAGRVNPELAVQMAIRTQNKPMAKL